MKILIVDDFPTMRRIIKTLLRQNGYENFVEAENGSKALQMVQNDPGIEFVISDSNMPVMNGLDFLKSLRADPRLKDLPFLMVIAEIEKDNVAGELGAGMANFVIKPFTGQTLDEKMKQIFSNLTKKAS